VFVASSFTLTRALLVVTLPLLTWAQQFQEVAANAPAEVKVGGRTVFTIQTSIGPFTPQERAKFASDRLYRVAHDLAASVDEIRAVHSETSSDVVLGDRVLFTVTDADARAAGKDRRIVAADHIASVRAAITAARLQYSSRSLLLGAGYAVLGTAAFLALVVFLRRSDQAALRKLNEIRIPAVRIQSIELISAPQLRRGLTQAIHVLRWLLILLAAYIYIPLVLSFFPWTREYSPKIIAYIVAPVRSAGRAVLDYLPSLFVVIITAAGAYLLIRFSGFIFREVGRGTISWPGFYAEWADPTHKIVRFLILAFAVVVAFPYLPGSRSPAFQGISIFLGLLFSLGSTSAVANVVSGVILTYTRAFRIGDRVKVLDTTGDVTERTLLATRIRTIKNEFVTVPNSMVLGSHIINFSASEPGTPLILHTSVTIGYDSPWRTVHALLIDAAKRTSTIVAAPEPFVLQTSLNDFFVTYEINAYTSEPSRMAQTYAELHQNIQDCFNAAGVEIMSPHYTSLRDGNATTIPADQLPEDYRAPAFRFEQSNTGRGTPEAARRPSANQKAPGLAAKNHHLDGDQA
jgi:small-conductance mechanosensitive channel